MRSKMCHATNPAAFEDPFALAERIASACTAAKGQDVLVLKVSDFFDLADYFVIASARSDRQAQGISNKVLEALTQSGIKPLSVVGLEEGQWVLVDCNEVVVHVFYEPLRRHYNIEGLWCQAEKYVFNEARAALAKKRITA